jgi:hypothetical protein
VFCERLFQAFGHEGYKEAGATLEYEVLDEAVRKAYGMGKRDTIVDFLFQFECESGGPRGFDAESCRPWPTTFGKEAIGIHF